MKGIVMTCRPVVNAAYRRRLVQMGLNPTDPKLNPKPARGSVQVTCDVCGCRVWMGPRQQAVLPQVADKSARHLVTVTCLLCAMRQFADASRSGKPDMVAHLGGD